MVSDPARAREALGAMIRIIDTTLVPKTTPMPTTSKAIVNGACVGADFNRTLNKNQSLNAIACLQTVRQHCCIAYASEDHASALCAIVMGINAYPEIHAEIVGRAHGREPNVLNALRFDLDSDDKARAYMHEAANLHCLPEILRAAAVTAARAAENNARLFS
jgi:hypothetical protein